METIFFTLILIPLLFITISNRFSNKLYYLFKTLGYGLLGFVITYLFIKHLIDHLSLIYGLASTYISLLISLYSREYIVRKNYPKYTLLLIDLFSYTMITAYISPNIIILAVTWTIAELLACELISIGVKHSLEGYTKASTLFLFLSTFTFELSIFTIIYTYVYEYTEVLSISAIDALNKILLASFKELSQNNVAVPDYLFIFSSIGFIVKSAQIPLHFWLVGAHTSAPSPASALLSGVTTAMGIYGFLRIHMFFKTPLVMLYVLITISTISIIYSGLQAIFQRDGKQLLAYSTILGNGFSIMLYTYYCYTNSNDIFTILLVSVLAHMSYKSTLFLDIGLVEEIYGFRYLHRIRGLNNIIPYSTIGSVIAILSLIGIPPTIGFISKLFTIVLSLKYIYEPLPVTILLITIVYMVLTIPIGLNYVRIHFGSINIGYTNLFEKKSIESIQQKIVFINSLSNIFFILALLIEIQMYSIFIVATLALSPLLILILYLLTIIMRRE